jgi:nucleoid-associated protein YgaU
MALNRYSRSTVVGLNQRYATSFAVTAIRANLNNGGIRFNELVLDERERLDILAGKAYGDGRLWWVIAAASDIGYGLQVPPGTRIRIPNLEDVGRFVG